MSCQIVRVKLAGGIVRAVVRPEYLLVVGKTFPAKLMRTLYT